MKKTYESPRTVSWTLETAPLLQASINTLNSTTKAKAGDTVLSREDDYWDDDEY